MGCEIRLIPGIGPADSPICSVHLSRSLHTMPVRPIQPDMIAPGMTLDRPIFTRQGIKLVGKGITLSPAMCDALRELAAAPGPDGPQWNLFFAETASEMRTAKILTTHRGSPSKPLTADVVTMGGRLPLEYGEQVEEIHRRAYSLGSFTNPDSRESRRHRSARLKLADTIVSDLQHIWNSVPLRVEHGTDPLDLSKSDDHTWPDIERLTRFRADRVAQLAELYSRCLAGVAVDLEQPQQLVDELVELLSRYPRQFTQLALLFQRGDDFVVDHAYSTGALCVAIGARLGWGRRDLRTCGLAGMLADLGMTMVPREIRAALRPLNESEINRVWRHPTWSVVLMEDIAGVPESVRRAVYQHHERENGGGYPQRLKSAKICDYAKVIAVADAYAAATHPRPYRRSCRPYEVVEQLIRSSAERMYDRRCVRALIESTGLFPVGSHVRLSSGELAEVIGAHSGMPDRPMVRVYRDAGGVNIPGPMIDLADFEPWTLHVIQAVESPERQLAA